MPTDHTDPSDRPRAGADHPVSPDGPRRPQLVVFDVNETLSDMGPMARRFVDVGAPAHLAATWFAGVLRDGFALAAVGTSASFAQIAADSLGVTLYGLPLDRPAQAAIEHIMEGFADLPVHADVPDGVRALEALGIRLVTLSNGAVSVAESLFERAGIRPCFESLLSVESSGLWKPARAAYDAALERCGADAQETMLVAVHPWDIDGASRAGLATAWLNRSGAPYPAHFVAPDLQASSLVDLAAQLS
ncbi:haloacid dehalogenase type II [Sanguibacter antarcticus]|nr:haloacid dehalogenase type II [Sanguibacter antarcticus]